MQKSLDRKLAAIHADPSGCREFIIADAKDADMAFGIGSAGRSPEAHPGEVHLCVGVVRYDSLGRARKGVCSTFLAERVPFTAIPRLVGHALETVAHEPATELARILAADTQARACVEAAIASGRC